MNLQLLMRFVLFSCVGWLDFMGRSVRILRKAGFRLCPVASFVLLSFVSLFRQGQLHAPPCSGSARSPPLAWWEPSGGPGFTSSVPSFLTYVREALDGLIYLVLSCVVCFCLCCFFFVFFFFKQKTAYEIRLSLVGSARVANSQSQ